MPFILKTESLSLPFAKGLFLKIIQVLYRGTKKISNSTSSRGRGASSSGFTLIEVVLALGIAATALVSLFGLLPTGLKTFRNTVNTAVSSQIAERAFNDIQVANWSDVQSTNRYFDEQGNELTNSGSSNAPNCLYWVLVNITNSLSGTAATSTTLMGSTSTNLMTVTIMVANNPRGILPGSTVFTTTNPSTMVFTTLIGRNK
jgi:uncharacterized protein (TIGR02598 family)